MQIEEKYCLPYSLRGKIASFAIMRCWEGSSSVQCRYYHSIHQDQACCCTKKKSNHQCYRMVHRSRQSKLSPCSVISQVKRSTSSTCINAPYSAQTCKAESTSRPTNYSKEKAVDMVILARPRRLSDDSGPRHRRAPHGLRRQLGGCAFTAQLRRLFADSSGAALSPRSFADSSPTARGLRSRRAASPTQQRLGAAPPTRRLTDFVDSSGAVLSPHSFADSTSKMTNPDGQGAS